MAKFNVVISASPFLFFFYTFNITRLDPEINSRKLKKKDETTTLLLATYSKE